MPLIIANAGANALTGDAGLGYIWRTSFANSESPPRSASGWPARQDGKVFLLAPDYAAGKEAGRLQGGVQGGRWQGRRGAHPFGTTRTTSRT